MASGTGTAYVIISASNSQGPGYGQSADCYLFGDGLGATGHHFADTTAFHNDPPLDMRKWDQIGIQLVTVNDSGQTLTGAWKIEISNDFVPPGNGSYGQSPQAGTFTDVTAIFAPTINAVAGASNQYAQAHIRCRALRVTFTPTP